MTASGPDDKPFEPQAIFELLLRHGVEFVVVGGVAGNLHGSTTFTYDTDICYRRTPENFERLAAALRELGVSLRGADPDLPFKVDALTIRAGLNFTFNSPLGDFDCLGDASGYTYEVLAPNAHVAPLSAVEVLVADLDDLIRMKRAAGRYKDLVEVENLSKLREVREAHGIYGLAGTVAPRRRTGRGVTSAASRSRSRSRAP